MAFGEKSLGELIREILTSKGMSVEAFCVKYEFSRPTVFRWMKEDGSVKKLPYRIVEAIADVARTTPADIYQRIGIDILLIPSGEGELPYGLHSLAPLDGDINGDPKIREAVKAAFRAKWIYCYSGTLRECLAHYERALSLALEAKAKRLATYLKLHVANLLEMTGVIDTAERLIQEVQNEAERLLAEANKQQNETLTMLGRRFYIDARIRWLWTHYWARGVTQESMQEGIAFLEELKRTPNYRNFPHPYIFLARCATALGNSEQALEFMETGELREFSLARDRHPRMELFLDVEPNLTGAKDYSWKEDQALGGKADILIAAGRPDEAFATYRLIKLHRRPRAFLCFHNWHNPGWQQFLRTQTEISEEVDIKLGYKFDDYDDELETSGQKRVQALNVYAQGEQDAANGDHLLAGFRFKRAQQLADECHAVDVRVLAAIASSQAAAARSDRELAAQRLLKVEHDIHRINNPLLHERYRMATEAIAQL